MPSSKNGIGMYLASVPPYPAIASLAAAISAVISTPTIFSARWSTSPLYRQAPTGSWAPKGWWTS